MLDRYCRTEDSKADIYHESKNVITCLFQDANSYFYFANIIIIIWNSIQNYTRIKIS